MPEKTLNAFAAHGAIGASLPLRATDVFAEFAAAGIDTDALAAQLQVEGAASFVKSWTDLMSCIDSKNTNLKAA